MKDQVVKAYKSEKFQNSIRDASFKIKEILDVFIYREEKKYGNEHKINRNINSRIKSVESFAEKLERNNYINDWNLDGKTEIEIQNIICEKLPDLIGFRINCYFDKSEKILFDDLRVFLSEKDNIQAEENPNTKQNNGNYIAKIACVYKDRNNQYPFEVQVKSYLNDVWGEVEHDIIYKSKIYDSRDSAKKEIMKSVNSILKGTDKELDYMYNEIVTIQDVKKELFFHLTHDELFGNNTLNIGKHYNSFFDLLEIIPDYKKDLDGFLGMKLLNEKYDKKIIEENGGNLSLSISESIDVYKWNCVSKIFGILYSFNSDEKLLEYLLYQVSKDAQFPDNDFEVLDDSFADDDYDEKDNNPGLEEDIRNKFGCILKKKENVKHE